MIQNKVSALGSGVVCAASMAAEGVTRGVILYLVLERDFFTEVQDYWLLGVLSVIAHGVGMVFKPPRRLAGLAA